MNPKDKLIVALDTSDERRALKLVDELKEYANIFKVGSELFASCGPGIIKRIRDKGAKVFLDLKFHDIPNTVQKAAASITRLGVFIFNVHSLGGYEMMAKTAESVKDEAKRLNVPRPKVLAVTILTSLDKNGLKKVGINANIESEVLRLAALAKSAGLDGVVASPVEAKIIRKKFGQDFLIVTPGVRPSWAGHGDQKRTTTPKEAISNGADFIVVGRPIIDAAHPRAAAKKILEEIEI